MIPPSLPPEISSPVPAHISLSFRGAKVYHHPDHAVINQIFYGSQKGMLFMENCIDAIGFEKRKDARKIYQRTCLENKMMIFVKDMENIILKSYVTPID